MSSAEALVELGRRRLIMGDHRGGIEYLKQALGADPSLALGHSLLAAALLDLKRLHAAGVEASIALRLDPNDAFGLSIAAQVAVAQLRLDEAESLLEQAIAVDPEWSLPLRRLAELRVLQHRKPDAL